MHKYNNTNSIRVFFFKSYRVGLVLGNEKNSWPLGIIKITMYYCHRFFNDTVIKFRSDDVIL